MFLSRYGYHFRNCCYYVTDQIVHFETSRRVSLMVPIHFVDIPGIVPSKPIPNSVMFGNVFTGLTYTALVAHKVSIIDVL